MSNEDKKFFLFIIPASLLGFILDDKVFSLYKPYDKILFIAYIIVVGIILFKYIIRKNPW
ncbi:hypothetical protein IMX26_03480 [Clostridium sp. 'deep sea']|uniref:hypothetical protein n=1 Tax=Clostridium sp. 'deep sea' TaxID=2779445 RepID=UPI00189644D5|nr:hypothetical protein [Clostridium sp. 'deep sea']QOR35892.1 hypothetical protein IMX26_03480 [Clostridium sp. 'deep sea']